MERICWPFTGIIHHNLISGSKTVPLSIRRNSHSFCFCWTHITPNCNNVVIEKWKKGKSQIIRLTEPHSQGRLICSCCISPLKFFLFFSFKTIANSNRQIRRPCADAANEFTRLISLINSYLAFSFFHFSKTTSPQLGINKFVFYQRPKLYNPLNTDVDNSQKCLWVT